MSERKIRISEGILQISPEKNKMHKAKIINFMGLVPLRGGSKSIPYKNIKYIAGRPLCIWAIEAALQSKIFSRIVVSSDSTEIIKVIKNMKLPVEIDKRPAYLSNDETPTEEVMLYIAGKYKFDVMTTIQVTNPLTIPEDFIKASELFITGDYDSLLTGVRVKKFFWSLDGIPLDYNPAKRPRRQEFPGIIVENGAFYMTKKEILIKSRCRIGGKVGIYEMDSNAAEEIDEISDWERIENILQKRNQNRFRSKFKK
jgi:CMP-N-acetylneuraminic acid synthetase